ARARISAGRAPAPCGSAEYRGGKRQEQRAERRPGRTARLRLHFLGLLLQLRHVLLDVLRLLLHLLGHLLRPAHEAEGTAGERAHAARGEISHQQERHYPDEEAGEETGARIVRRTDARGDEPADEERNEQRYAGPDARAGTSLGELR